jgi:EvpB/VC_A0108, tail sheath N-terminal domain
MWPHHKACLGLLTVLRGPVNTCQTLSVGQQRLALALPRLLLRLLYGAETKPADSFTFEEQIGGNRHELLLWGKTGLAVGLDNCLDDTLQEPSQPPGLHISVDSWNAPTYTRASTFILGRLVPLFRS